MSASHYITRSELAGLLDQALELSSASPTDHVYRDIADKPTQELAARMRQAGLMSGHPDGTFRPLDLVTRAQAVAVLHTAAQRLPDSPARTLPVLAERKDQALPFQDVPAGYWARPAIYLAWQKGLVAGTAPGRFLPDQGLTAWQLAQLLQRFLGPEPARRAGLDNLLTTPAPQAGAQYVPVLLYHHLAPSGSGFKDNRATITPEEFAWQMDYLAVHGYNVLTVTELAASLEGKISVPEKSVAITFDDGYASNLMYAFPVLKKHNFPAIINVITGDLLERPQLPYDVRRLQRLSSPELKELAASGLISIGSHTDNLHTYVPSGPTGVQRPALVARILDPTTGRVESEAAYRERILADLTASRAKLERELGSAVTVLAFPYGVSDVLSRKLAAEAGFTLTFGTRSAPARRGSGLSDVPRLVVPPGLTPDQFDLLLKQQ